MMEEEKEIKKEIKKEMKKEIKKVIGKEIKKVIGKEVMGSAVVLCLIGLPASGKSNLASEIRSDAPIGDFFTDIHIIDTDSIRSASFGDEFRPENESTVIVEKYERISALIEPEHLIIVDDLHYLTSMRHTILEICNQHHANYISIYVKSSLDQCLVWNKLRGSPIPDSVIHRVAQKFDEPGKKYAWDQASLIYNPGKMEISQFLSKLYKLLEQIQISLSLKSKAKIDNDPTHVSQSGMDSLKNSIDLQSRRLIGLILSRTISISNFQRLLKILNLSSGGGVDSSNLGNLLNSHRKKFVSWLVNQTETEVTLDNFFEFLSLSL
ncbi:MAG: AAA family ATPase [Promethearchaeota archaeon]